MKYFKEYITEEKIKNIHISHLDDLVFNGVEGTRSSISFLQSFRDMLSGNSKTNMNISIKFDGSPSIVTGINPDNGKFFVGTKSVFNKNPKINYTIEDIDNNHPDGELNKILKLCLKYLPELEIRGILQGDFLFSKDTLKVEKDLLTFQPNTIIYGIPIDSALAKKIMKSQIGIVFHTSYFGGSMDDLSTQFSVDIGYLRNSKNVWYRDATFVDVSGTATFTLSETNQMNEYLSEIGKIFRKLPSKFLNQIYTNDFIKSNIKQYNNSKIKDGLEISDTIMYTKNMILWVESKLNKSIVEAKRSDTKYKRLQEKKLIMDFFKSNRDYIKLMFDLRNLIIRAKSMILVKLSTIQDIGTFKKDGEDFKVTTPEGFVASDSSGNVVKIVDKLVFTRDNFAKWNK